MQPSRMCAPPAVSLAPCGAARLLVHKASSPPPKCPSRRTEGIIHFATASKNACWSLRWLQVCGSRVACSEPARASGGLLVARVQAAWKLKRLCHRDALILHAGAASRSARPDGPDCQGWRSVTFAHHSRYPHCSVDGRAALQGASRVARLPCMHRLTSVHRPARSILLRALPFACRVLPPGAADYERR